MRNALKVLILALGVAVSPPATSSRSKWRPRTRTCRSTTIVLGEVSDNAQIETLPPDESSTTPSEQLQSGYDNPDVNDLGNGD